MAITRSSIGKEVTRTPMKPKLGSGARFKALTKQLAAKGADNPKALAAYIGRKKYGAKGMAKLSAAGRKTGGKVGAAPCNRLY
jgi:hypothetical protein